MKRHVEYGCSILSQSKGITEVSLLTAGQHHERLNGSGYPAQLKGDEISLFGRIAAIADVYDAMTSRRYYQNQIHPTEVMKRLYQWSGELFDPELIQKFIKCIGIYPVGTIVRLKNGFLGIVTSVKSENLLQPVVKVFYDLEKNRFVPPFTMNLSEDSTNPIVGYEPLDKWSISIDQII
jgi:HD-GYP domain-containing protein (c-di-GMP phosphodiesterase class II)